MKPDRNLLLKLATELGQVDFQKTATIGFDGYVDILQQVVQQRKEEHVAFYESITEFSTRVQQAAGKSAQLELVPKVTKQGGNAPIMALALSRLGIGTTCCGMLGYPQLHPVFDDLGQVARLISLGQPAHTTALEFEDGKLILSDLNSFQKLNWEMLVERMGMDRIKKMLEPASLVAMVGLSNMPHAQGILTGILEDILPAFASWDGEIFFDLADTTRLASADTEATLNLLSNYSQFGRVTLGLNENEALDIHRLLYADRSPDLALHIQEISNQIYEGLDIARLLVHPIDCACWVDADQSICIEGRLVKDPKILTGAGDNLNAGFCLGILLGWEPASCLILGMANSGAYIALGHSPDRTELSSYLVTWASELQY